MRAEDATDVVITKRVGRTLVVTINRPAALNAINPDVSARLRSSFEQFRDDATLAVAVLAGAGHRAFSAGNDLVAMSRAQARGRNNVSAAYSAVPFGGITRDYESGKVIIAAIHGYCLAGGLELALACDVRIAASNAVFGFPEVRRGLVPGAGGTQRLPKLIGAGRALEMILSGSHFDADWAANAGLVNRVVEPASLMPAALELAEQFSQGGPIAVRLAKEAIQRGLNISLEAGLSLERRLSRRALKTWDAKEGPRAFLEKREPRFRGE